MNKIHPKSRAVNTPYGFFFSITDAAKYIYNVDKRLREKNVGRHPYNTIINIRSMVSKRCISDEYPEWWFE